MSTKKTKKQFKVGDRVTVKSTSTHGNNCGHILKKGYMGKITSINEVSSIFPQERWVYVDGKGGIIEHLLKHSYTTWREKYNEL